MERGQEKDVPPSSETKGKENDEKMESRLKSRHRLLKKRQQQRLAYRERHNLIKVRIKHEGRSNPYNFNPLLPLEELQNQGVLPRGRTLSARYREAKGSVTQTKLDILNAVDTLSDRVHESESKKLGVWKKLPNISSDKPASRPVITSATYREIGGTKEEVGSVHFRTLLPPLMNKTKELTFRDAIYRKETGALKRLIQHRRDQRTLTIGELNHALLIAINRRETEMAEILLMSGAEANAFKEYNPLIIQAAFTNSTDTVQLLLQFGGDPNVQKDPQYTPLYFACHRNNFEMVKVLVKGGADVTLSSRDNLTPLMVAARTGNLKCVRYLLFHCSDNVKEKDAHGKTALHYAASSGKRRIVENLLKHGAEIFVPDTQHVTPYTAAMTGHHKELTDFLLPSGDIDLRITDQLTGHGNTMLWYAVNSGHTPSAQFLIDKGASVSDASQGFPYPILKCALEQKNLEMIKALVPHTNSNLPVHFDSDLQLNAIQYFVRDKLPNGQKDVSEVEVNIIEYLSKSGSDINGLSENNDSILLMSSSNEDTSYKVKVLLQYGANPNIIKDGGITALWYACNSLDCDLIKLLIDHNFDMTLSDLVGRNGLTPMQMILTQYEDHTESVVHMVSAGACLHGIGRMVDNILSNVSTNQTTTSNGPNQGQTQTQSDDTEDTPTDAMVELLGVLKRMSVTPRPLQEISKLAIKRHISHNNVDQLIDRLPLPPALREYLRPRYMDGYLETLMKQNI